MRQLITLNADLEQQFSLGHWERWDYDAFAGTITFSEEGTPKIIADVQVVGTTSNKSNNWLWGWANQSVPVSVSAVIQKVREFGLAESLPVLIEPYWPDEECHGWDMTAVATRVLTGRGGYRTPRSGGGFTYYVFTAIRFASEPPIAN